MVRVWQCDVTPEGPRANPVPSENAVKLRFHTGRNATVRAIPEHIVCSVAKWNSATEPGFFIDTSAYRVCPPWPGNMRCTQRCASNH
jgi:hypothetical protein